MAAPTPADDFEWLRLTDSRLEIDGLPWLSESGGLLQRLPPRMKDLVVDAVWEQALCPSGGRIRFRTDAKRLAIRLVYPSPPDMLNMHAMGQTGVDLYVDGIYRKTAFADRNAGPQHLYERTYFDFSRQPRTAREIVLYLPIYKPVRVEGIGIDPEAQLLPSRRFALSKPVVFYGTSITQGGCASRGGMSYPAILGRMLNLDFVNLGFSGQGTGGAAEAAIVASLDAACFVIDYGINNGTVDSLEKVYAPFLDTLRKKHPAVPILAITPIHETREAWPGGEPPPWAAMRALVRREIGRRIASGDRHIQIVEGTDLLGPSDADGYVDGTHPNDLGFQRIAERLAPRLRKLLGL